LKWIKALELEQWADTLQAKDKMPGLVSELIWASASKVRRLRFLQGDKGQVRGFDGYLDVDSISPFVPNGLSIWEFGTSGAGKSKAESDYKKRTEEVDEETRAKCTLVIVTPRTWNTPTEKVEDWLTEKNGLKDWKSVVYLDGPLLEDWLAKCPAVSSRWASCELRIAPQNGVLSTEEFWQSFSSRFAPPLVEDVLLAGRETQAEELLQNLTQEGGRLAFAADTPDEVIAFTVAAIRMAPESVRRPLEARTVIVETEDAARFLISTSNLIYLPRNAARSCAGQLKSYGPTVISAGADEKKHDHVELRRPTSRELGKAFVKMGMSDDEGYEAARKCGRSLAVLARQCPGGTAERPKWLEDAKPLIPAMLAGAWVSGSELDESIFSSLSQKDYDEAEDELRKYLVMQDSPIECVGNLWATKASVDAFLHLGPLIGRKHLQLFKDAVTIVFDKAAQSHKPPSADEPFVFHDKRERETSHSEHLRNGLMTTLLHMAVLHEPAGFTISGGNPQAFVDDLIRSLPGLSSDHRLMASLGQDLALLAEASPTFFLEALERQLEGATPSIRPIFDEHPGMLTPVTYHSGLLWALEVLAWDSVLLDRAVLCLAKLAAIDPGGKLSNRPINSLRAIFLSWVPGTAVKTKRRLAVLQATLKAVPSIAWPLLAMLLPQSNDNSSPTAKPKFREYEQDYGETLTYGLVWQSEAKIVALAIDEAELSAERWSTLIDAFPNLQNDPFEAVVDRLGEVLSALEGEPRTIIWKALHREVKRHQKYSSFDWAMPQERVERLVHLIDKHMPTTLVETYSWLFDDFMPPVEGVDDEDADPIKVVDCARLSALREIHESLGVQGFLELMECVKVPRLVIYSARGLELPYDQLFELFSSLISSSVQELELAAGSAMADGIARYGQRWEKAARAALQSGVLGPDRIGRVFESLPEQMQTWLYVASFGEEIERAYWTHKTPYPIAAGTKELLFAVEKYRAVERSTAALSAVSRRLSEIPTNDVVSLLADGVAERNASPGAQMASSFFDIEKVISDLSERSDVTLQQLAGLEFIYLPALRNDPRALHRLLLEQPSFFMEMVCKVFRAKDEEPREVSEHDRKYATNAYRLLKSLKTLPGQTDQEVDEPALLGWCLDVRRLAKEQNRQAIADQLIGQVLAHAPLSPKDEAWPHEAVRSVIESLASAEIERGISIERINMRGVFSKQIGEGGDQERALARQSREWADVSSEFVRTSAMLQRIAQSWVADAERADTAAQQQMLRF
jgi:hypothetical protein